MPKFIHKPIIVDAVQWIEGEVCKKELEEFITVEFKFLWNNPPFMKIKTTELTPDGWKYASLGDWIIKRTLNDFDVCKPDELKEKYELMEVKQTQNKYKL